MNYRFYRILCGTPADLEAEAHALESAIADLNQRVAMPDGSLFAPAMFRTPVAARIQQALPDNVRTSDFFVLVVGESWPEPLLEGVIEQVLGCLSEPSMPMRNMAIFFRNYQAAAEELRRLRDSLAVSARCETKDYSTPEEFATQFGDLLQTWYTTLRT